ncbi:MAG: M48 family metallopeptidase [Bryobacteraceae bacterium]
MQAVASYTLPPDQYARAIAYAHARYALHFASFAVSVLVLAAMLRFRMASRLRRYHPAIVIGAVLILAALADLPLDAIRHSLGLRFDISVQSWPSWFWDWTKEQLAGLIIGISALWPFYILLRGSPRRWWIYAWLASIPISIASVYADPWLFEPLFNKFEPLARAHPELVAPIEGLLHRAGISIPSERLFQMDASTKTNSLNAYVSGFGPSRRVVLYDTIIRKESGPALLTTFGHELGHYALDHIGKGLLFGSVLFLIGIFLASRTIRFVIAGWGARLGIREVSDLASLPLFLLFIEVAGLVSEPLVNAYSRYQEHEADVYSLEVTHGVVPDAGQAAARAFQIEGETDLEEPTPNPFIVFWMYSHPPTAERLRFALEYDPWSQGRAPKYVR